MRWIFQLFEGIDLLIVHQDGVVVNRQVLNLHPAQRTVLRMLGPPVEKCYLLAKQDDVTGTVALKAMFPF
jgi:hypothetical protein